MAFEVTLTTTLGGQVSGPIPAASYSYSEQSSPLSGADSSGSVGTFEVILPVPDPNVPVPTAHVMWARLLKYGDAIFMDATVDIADARKGLTTGLVKTVTRSKDQRSITLSGVTRMALMNVYNTQAQPYSGSLGGAVAYYLGLAGITSGFIVDPSIAGRQVSIPGWFGELWLHMKQLMAANDCDISLVSNVIQVRPLRKRIAQAGRDITRSSTTGNYSLAQAVEVYQYNNRQITNELVCPPGGPYVGDQVLNVNAGESADYTLELSASLSSIQQPEHLTAMSIGYTTSSAYVITSNSGEVITPERWQGGGGSVTIGIAPSTTDLTVRLVGPVGLVAANGDAMTSFSLSLSDPETGNRFSTLRILGTGVAFKREKKRIRTGVPASQAATDVGITIDNPNVSTDDDAARVGIRATRQFAGTAMSVSGSVVSINRRGDSGQATVPTYAQVQAALQADIGGTPTYAQLATYYSSRGLTTYEKVYDYWVARFANPDLDQVFGNVQGARIYDENTKRWYRIRQARLTPEGISFDDAEDDLLYSDFETFWAGKTYQQYEAAMAGMTYRQGEMIGLTS